MNSKCSNDLKLAHNPSMSCSFLSVLLHLFERGSLRVSCHLLPSGIRVIWQIFYFVRLQIEKHLWPFYFMWLSWEEVKLNIGNNFLVKCPMQYATCYCTLDLFTYQKRFFSSIWWKSFIVYFLLFTFMSIFFFISDKQRQLPLFSLLLHF